LLLQAVWEELPGAAAEYGSKRKDLKQRAFSRLVTPENPAYLHGYADSSSDRDVNVPTLSGELYREEALLLQLVLPWSTSSDGF
jgi:hypothetical protein